MQNVKTWRALAILGIFLGAQASQANVSREYLKCVEDEIIERESTYNIPLDSESTVQEIANDSGLSTSEVEDAIADARAALAAGGGCGGTTGP